MPDNRRRHANAVPVAKCIISLMVAITACAGGLSYVWCKNSMYATGLQIKKYEAELDQLRTRTEATRTSIAKLSSTAELHKRFKAGAFTSFENIAQQNVFIVESAPTSPTRAELRPAANDMNRP